MNESEFRELIEVSWRRPLSAEEQVQLEAWLALHPEDEPRWESEALLNRHLAALPDVPFSSNFTGLVMQAVEREAARAKRSPSFTSRLKSLFGRPILRLGWALVVGCAAWIGYLQHQAGVRADVAKGVSVLVNVTPGLEDFDAIRSLGESEDDALYAALNQ